MTLGTLTIPATGAMSRLTPREKLKVGYFYEMSGIAQHVLVDMFEVNSGRIAEAIVAVHQAIDEDESNE
jgi:hypothetical protein